MLITTFPYSDARWLVEDSAEGHWQGATVVEFLGAPVPWASVMPAKVHAASGQGVYQLWVRSGEFEQGFTVVNKGASREEEADTLSDLLDAERIPSDGLREFGRLDFDDQLAWYQQHGQVPYECTRGSALRDLKKYHVEETLGTTISDAQPGSASIDRFGLSYSTEDGTGLFGISRSGWLRIGFWSGLEAEVEEVEAEFDAHEMLAMFETLVLGEISPEEFRGYLESSGIDFEFNEM